MNDLVVIIPGITGSALADAQGREVWGLRLGTIARALAGLGGSLRSLTLPDGFEDDPAPDGVQPTGLMMGFHVIPGVWSPAFGYGELVRFLKHPRFGLTLDGEQVNGSSPGNLILFAYDWRLSNRRIAKQLKLRVEPALDRWRASAPERADAKVVFICHSMGGLVARWFADCLGGAAITRSIVTIGTPHRGALQALGQLVNGVSKGIGPLQVDFTRFARSLPSTYELLPEYACIEGPNGALSKTTECVLPRLDAARAITGMEFHDKLDSAPDPPYSLIPIVGIGQLTATTARIDGDRVEVLSTIKGRDRMGDGTVPRFAARPKRLVETDPSIRGVGDGHGALPGNRSVLDQLDFALTAEEVVYRVVESAEERVDESSITGVSVSDLHIAGEQVDVRVAVPERRVFEVVAFDETGSEADHAPVQLDGTEDDLGRFVGTASFERLKPGGIKFVARRENDPDGRDVRPVWAATLIWGDT